MKSQMMFGFINKTKKELPRSGHIHEAQTSEEPTEKAIRN